MSTITRTGTLTYDGVNFLYRIAGAQTLISFTEPITISAGVTVTFGSDLTLIDTIQYFIIGVENVTIDGAGYTVNVPENYTGLVQNGSSSAGSGFSNCLVKNIGLLSSGSVNSGIARSYFGNGASNCSITNCYVICGGNISGGIADRYNSGSISNCYVIVGGNIQGTGGGIAGQNNAATISNCYVICGGSISDGSSANGGIAGPSNSGPISNCYVIIGGDIGYGGGIASEFNSEEISNCYVICGGNIGYGGGIAAFTNSGPITNCYVNYYNATATNENDIISRSSRGQITSCGSSDTPEWTYGTNTGAAKLSSGWTNTDSTKPWLLSAFNVAIASPTTTATSDSGSIDLNAYGEAFANGTVYSGTNGATFTYNVGSNIGYSGISYPAYTLGLYAYDLLSNLTSISFSFVNSGAAIITAFNQSSSTLTAEQIVPYIYSVTNVSLTYSAAVDCFLEGTKILTDKGYVNIEKLTKEHLVITLEGKKRIYKIGKCTMDNLAVQEKIKDQLYVYSNSDYQQITQGDLVITGGHSILVDSFENKQQEEDTKKILGEIFLTKNKLRLPVCLDKRSRVYEEKGEKTIYHIALEHIHYDCNYGIYANGLLVESCSQNYIDNKSDNLVCIEM